MVYPEGLNRTLELVLTPLPESLTHDMSMLNDPAFLLVDLSSDACQEASLPKASAPHRTSDTYLPYSSHYGMSS